jgi:hypothetical protein
MDHIFAASSLKVTGNPDTHPSEAELHLPDGQSIAELLDGTKNQKEVQGKDDTRQGNRETLS